MPVFSELVLRFGDKSRLDFQVRGVGDLPPPQRNLKLLGELEKLEHKDRIGSNPNGFGILIAFPALAPVQKREAVKAVKWCFHQHDYELEQLFSSTGRSRR